MDAPMRPLRILLVVAAVALAGCGACGDQPLVLRKVLVDVEPPASAGVDRDVVRGAVHAALRDRDGVKVDEAAGEGAVLRVRVEAATSAAPGEGAATPYGPSTLALSVEVQGGGDGGRRFAYRGHSVASAAGALPLDALVRQAFEDALSQVQQARGADRADSDVLLGWLQEGGRVSDDQKRQAIRILGARRDARAVEPLTKVLLGPDRELAQLALSALTSIGDPAAVDAVIAYSDKKPSLVRKQCIEAVRVMGTPKAAAWLFTLSTGHQDGDVQAAAAAALASLEASDPGGTQVAEQQPPGRPEAVTR